MNTCYYKEKENEELIIQFAVKNGENISSLVKQEHLIDFVNPISSSAIIKPMNIYKIVSEITDGIEPEFVHLQSIQHKRNEEKFKGKIDLSLLNLTELHNICSKTVDEWAQALVLG